MYSKLIQEHIRVLSVLNSDAGSSMLVGGCVREFVSNKTIEKDVDISTTFLPSEVFAILKTNFTNYIYLSNRDADYGTIFFHYNGFEYEITTTREDVVCHGRHAEVKFCKDFFVDSKRRDFSFNALYVNINGRMYDFHNGLDDLKNKRICFIGSVSERIEEDYLRIVRYYRFCVKMNAIRSIQDVQIIQGLFNGLNFISKERIKSEFQKMFLHSNWQSGLEYMIEDGLMEFLFGGDFFVKNGMNKDINYKNIILNLYYYFQNISVVSNIISKIVPSNEEKRLLLTISHFEKYYSAESLNDAMKFDLYKGYYKEGQNLSLVIIFFKPSLQKEIYTFLNNAKKLPLDGNDVISFGFTGVEVGRVIEKLTQIYIQSNFVLDKENLLQKIL